jgi:fructan beta-fructosidase
VTRSEPTIDPGSSRPVFHFTAPHNWLNDPNGLVYVDGEYHLFYQHHPHTNTFGSPHWGHAVSHDLVRWTHLPVALEPDELGLIFSGSAVVDTLGTSPFGRDAMVAVFTHHLEDGVERQSVAYSSDLGRTWQKYSGNPVLRAPADQPNFRDPRVLWWQGAEGGHWVMLLAVGVSVWIYTSPDLVTWSLASKFEPDPESAKVWECPDLVRLPIADIEHRWVMAVGADGGETPNGYGTRYFIGDFDGFSFRTEHTESHWADHGADFYAAQSWTGAPDGRVLWIGWMNNWAYARSIPTAGWRGAMSVPRELGLANTAMGPRLTQRPIAELDRYRRPLLGLGRCELGPGENPASGVQSSALDIDLTLDAGASVGTALRISVRVGGPEATVVQVDFASAGISVDRYRAGRHVLHREYSGPRLAPLAVGSGEVDVRILVDATSVEVFAGGGVVCITEQIFPSPDSRNVVVEAVGGSVVLGKLEIYDIDPTAHPD